jgi:hypothetical protein
MVERRMAAETAQNIRSSMELMEGYFKDSK